MTQENKNIELAKIVKSVIKMYLNNTKYEFDDLYFEGILEALRAVEDYQEDKNTKLSTYVYTRVNYRMIYLIRREKAQKRDDSRNINLDMVLSDGATGVYSMDVKSEDNFEESLILEDFKRRFREQAEEILNSEEYKYIEMYLKGYKVEEIAEKTGLTNRQISNKMYYIKRKLRNNKDKFLNLRKSLNSD